MNSSGHFGLNLTGAAQTLATGFTLGANDPEATAPIRWLSLQPFAANGAVIYVGFAGNVLSSSNYAFRLEAPVSTIPPAPFIIEGLMVSLAQIQILGTLNEDIAVGYIRG